MEPAVTLRRLCLWTSLTTNPSPQTKKAMDALAKNKQMCLLCLSMFQEFQTSELRTFSCGHCVCTKCWKDIEFLDPLQAQIKEFLESARSREQQEKEKEKEKAEEEQRFSRHSSSPRLKRSPSSRGSSQSKIHRSGLLPELEPSVSSSFEYINPLIFKCPICGAFLPDLIQEYVQTEHPLSKIKERTEHMQCILDAVDSGDLSFFHRISLREIQILEPISNAVYKAKYQTTEVAIKYFKPQLIGFEWKRLYRELAIIQMCSHPYITKFFGAYVPAGNLEDINWDDKAVAKPFIVMEYSSETLAMVLLASNKTLELEETLAYATQIAMAVKFLHSLGIGHRDLKPNNVLIINKCAKLIDFGESRILKQDQRMTIVGTPFYEAPEVSSGTYTLKVDSYSFGKMLFELIVKSKNPSMLAEGQFYVDPNALKLPNGVPKNLEKLVCACYNVNPSARPNFEEIYAKLLELSKV